MHLDREYIYMGTANRREFLKTAAAAATASASIRSSASSATSAHDSGTRRAVFDLLRPPDLVSARFGSTEIVRTHYAARAWTCPGVRITAEPVQTGIHCELPISVMSQGKDLTYIHLRWAGRMSEGLSSIGDHWER